MDSGNFLFLGVIVATLVIRHFSLYGPAMQEMRQERKNQISKEDPIKIREEEYMFAKKGLSFIFWWQTVTTILVGIAYLLLRLEVEGVTKVAVVIGLGGSLFLVATAGVAYLMPVNRLVDTLILLKRKNNR